MRKAGFALLVVLVMALAASAQNCTTTTLNNYLGSGFNCTVNDQTYSDWFYSSESNPSGFAPPPSSVTASPITTPNNPGFQFTSDWYASNASGVLSMDSTFEFTVNSTTPMTDLSLSIGGVGFTGTGAVNLDETACLGAILPACSGGTIVTLSVFDSSSGSQLFNQVNFSGVNEISIEKDLSVISGTNGSAEVSVITDQFSEGTGTTPEPGTLTLFGAGAIAVFGFARRKLNL